MRWMLGLNGFLILALLAGILGLVTAPSWAMTTGAHGAAAATPPVSDGAIQHRASELTGKAVTNGAGETLGRITDIAIDAQGRAMALVAVEETGRVVTVDFGRLQLRDNEVVFAATADDLMERPTAALAEDRDAYERDSGERLEEWRGRLDEYASDAGREGAEAGRTVRDKVGGAWDDVEKNWNALKDASGDAWEEAKGAMERSWANLEAAWNEATDGDEPTQAAETPEPAPNNR